MIKLTIDSSKANVSSGLMMEFNDQDQQPLGGGTIAVPGFSFAASGSDENAAGNKAVRGGRRGCSEAAAKRQYRKIKNRESAARSRDRKLAYNIQQQIEIKELMKENEFLRKAIKVLSTKFSHKEDGDEKHCLKRTLSGPI